MYLLSRRTVLVLVEHILYGPACKILILIAYVQTPLINAHDYTYSNARGLKFGLSLHQHPYFVYARGQGCGESAPMRDSPEPLLLSDAMSTRNLVLWPINLLINEISRLFISWDI